MDLAGITKRRLANEHLIGTPLGTAVEAVTWFGAVQAQDYSGSKWGLAQRMAPGTTDEELDRVFDAGKLLRTHVMRPTWHFVTPADIRWMLALTGPRVQIMSAARYRELGLDAETLRKSARVITKALEGGNQLARAELAERLERSGVSPEGQRIPHILSWVELESLICSGARKGTQQTYALLEERVPATKPLAREEALSLLALRYFRSHGPATVHDFAWWSGLTVRDARAGIALNGDALATARSDGRTYFHAATSRDPGARLRTPSLHLLPSWDEYLVAYRDHAPTYDSVRLGGVGRNSPSMQRNIMTLNGQVIGSWKRTMRKDDVQIEANPLIELTPPEQEALHRAAGDYARFAGKARFEVVGLP